MFKIYSRAILTSVLLFTFLFTNGFIFAPVTVGANGSPQTTPFTQNWANTALITANDNWDSIPGIIGYRGDGITGGTGTDPQTLLGDGSATPVNVIANQSNPNTLTNGGIAEFELANPVVALNGSGTADAPHLVINLNTQGTTAVNVKYNLRDLDGSADDSTQQFALHYRVGSTGNFTNLPGGYVADATSGPNQATLVTPVNVTLPAAAENQPLVQIRIMTTNAPSNDEWVGIDDINITGNGGGPVLLSGVGQASPASIAAGSSSLLTVSVTPADTPPSTGIAVSADLSSIDLSPAQQFFDNGTNGDVTAGDNVFSYMASTVAGLQSGGRVFQASVTDGQGRSTTANINLSITNIPSAGVHLTMGNPSNAVTDINQPTNYLLPRAQFVMSYNRDKAQANWVAWHLDSSWLGSADRQDSYSQDPLLPSGWYRVGSSAFSGSGFDRGHTTPSGDRTASEADNDETFRMTNMMPQAPDNNQGPWNQLEEYLRTLVGQGNEVYIYSGGAGQGGVGSNGAANTVDAGRVVVPAKTWKIAVVLPNGINDADRVSKTTRIISVIMPNAQGIRSTPWRNFRTSVRQVEAMTGLNFFTNVKPILRQTLKTKVDNQ